MSSESDKLSGKAKKAIGHATDNKELEAKGKTQETKGTLKGKLKDAGEKVADKVDETTKKLDK